MEEDKMMKAQRQQMNKEMGKNIDVEFDIMLQESKLSNDQARAVRYFISNIISINLLKA